MRYESASAFRTALEERLKQTAANQGSTSPARLRKMVVFDRLLARLLVVTPDRWIIKGGVALDLRFGSRARATKDLDLARPDGEAAATEDLLTAADTDIGDFFTFRVEKARALDAAGDDGTVRYHVRADLAGRRFEEVTLDIGFDDPIPSIPDLLPGHDFLTFAGLVPIQVPALPLEQHLAEKVHAYTRTYGTDQASSRVKDLIDLVLIQFAVSFSASRVQEELARTFVTRGTHDLPAMLPIPPERWTTPYRVLASQVDLDPDVADGHRRAAAFLDPILGHDVEGNDVWDSAEGCWRRPQPESGVPAAYV